MAFRDLREAPLRYIVTRCRLVGQLTGLVSTSQQWTRATRSWDELVAYVFEAADGFLKPLQIRAEIARAMAVVEKVKPRFLLEIGTARGGTFFLFSRAAAQDALLVSLDLPAGRWGGGYSNWKTRIFRRMLLPGQKADFVRANSHDPTSLARVREILGGNLLDVLYIDGDHSYEGVKTDYEMYSSLVRPGGLIVFHDVALHDVKHDCHVDQLWSDLKLRFPSSEIVQDPKQGWAGIGILQNSAIS